MKSDKLLTVAQYAKKRGVSKFTVYSWISRGQAEKQAFKAVKFGAITLIVTND